MVYSLDLQLVVGVGRDLIKMSDGPSQSINKCSITLMSTSFSLSADNGHILCFYFDIWPLGLKGKKGPRSQARPGVLVKGNTDAFARLPWGLVNGKWGTGCTGRGTSWWHWHARRQVGSFWDLQAVNTLHLQQLQGQPA